MPIPVLAFSLRKRDATSWGLPSYAFPFFFQDFETFQNTFPIINVSFTGRYIPRT